MDNRINVCFCVQDRSGTYCNYVGAAMKSVADNTKEKVHFHIIHDNTVNEDNKDRLKQTAGQCDAELTLHLVGVEFLDVQNEWFGLYSLGSLFRLMIPDLMPELSKVIYLDADIMFMRDIAELWTLDVSDYCLAGVHDIGFERGIRLSPIIKDGSVEQLKYINSGVLVMNLELIRAYGNLLENGVNYIKNHPDTFLPDQDALNYLFKDEILVLGGVWNCFTKYERQTTKVLQEKVYHYAGEQVVSFANLTDYDKKYLEIRQSLPWGYELVSREMMAGLDMASNRVNLYQSLLKKLSDEKVKKIFWGYEYQSVRELCNRLTLKEGDYFIKHDAGDKRITNRNLPVKTYDSLKGEDKKKCLVFVLPDAEHGSAIKILEEYGFVKGEDFFPFPMLMTYEQGGYIK